MNLKTKCFLLLTFVFMGGGIISSFIDSSPADVYREGALFSILLALYASFDGD